MGVVGCGAFAPVPTPTPSLAEAGMGLPQQLSGETYPGARRELAGTLSVADNGCVYLDNGGVERLLIFPAGSAVSDPARLPDGTELRAGDELSGRGTVIRTETLPGGADGYWAYVSGYCTGDVPEAVVFDQLSADR